MGENTNIQRCSTLLPKPTTNTFPLWVDGVVMGGTPPEQIFGKKRSLQPNPQSPTDTLTPQKKKLRPRHTGGPNPNRGLWVEVGSKGRKEAENNMLKTVVDQNLRGQSNPLKSGTSIDPATRGPLWVKKFPSSPRPWEVFSKKNPPKQLATFFNTKSGGSFQHNEKQHQTTKFLLDPPPHPFNVQQVKAQKRIPINSSPIERNPRAKNPPLPPWGKSAMRGGLHPTIFLGGGNPKVQTKTPCLVRNWDGTQKIPKSGRTFKENTLLKLKRKTAGLPFGKKPDGGSQPPYPT